MEIWGHVIIFYVNIRRLESRSRRVMLYYYFAYKNLNLKLLAVDHPRRYHGVADGNLEKAEDLVECAHQDQKSTEPMLHCSDEKR